MGRDCIVEAEVAGENGRTGANECVLWMLENCAGLEGGVSAGDAAEVSGNGAGGEEKGDGEVGMADASMKKAEKGTTEQKQET
jgi:hypothetical protein